MPTIRRMTPPKRNTEEKIRRPGARSTRRSATTAANSRIARLAPREHDNVDIGGRRLAADRQSCLTCSSIAVRCLAHGDGEEHERRPCYETIRQVRLAARAAGTSLLRPHGEGTGNRDPTKVCVCVCVWIRVLNQRRPTTHPSPPKPRPPDARARTHLRRCSRHHTAGDRPPCSRGDVKDELARAPSKFGASS